jgi:HK97 gp10 family phage protein
MARKFLTGDKEIEATLKALSDKSADKVAKSALGAGLTVIRGAIRKAAPVGKTGNLKASIGKRLEKGKRGKVFTAKAGINVGKKTKKEKTTGVMARAPHAHLVALGTQRRSRKVLGGKFASITNPSAEQLTTGTMPANPFVNQAAASAMGAASLKMRKQAAKALAREVAKAAKRNR